MRTGWLDAPTITLSAYLMTTGDLKAWLTANRVPDDTVIGFHDHYGRLIPLDPCDLTKRFDARLLGARPPHVVISPPDIGEEPD